MKFFITLPEPNSARGKDPAFSFSAHGAQAFAEQLQAAFSKPAYSQKWLASLSEEQIETLDPLLLAIDEHAIVSAEQHDLRIDLVINTTLNGTALKHRLRLLAGNHWQLKDVW